tara:strand:- start:4927 stop:5943 length:1017 start_codon:yes stop_codon:yes gene_type:complete
MKKLFFIYICLSITVFLKSEPSDLYEKIEGSTVRISIWENYDEDGKYCWLWNCEKENVNGGSGVFLNKVNDKIYILTNAHVILDMYEYFDGESVPFDDSLTMALDTILLEDEYIFTYDDIIWWEDLDMAIISIDLNEWVDDDGNLGLSIDNFNVLEIYDGYAPPLLDVYAAGFPYVPGNTSDYLNIFVDKCVINSYVVDYQDFVDNLAYEIVHDCKIAGGMSGGPLVDSRGKLIGVNGLSYLPYIEQGFFGEITDSDYDSLNYNFAADIWQLYFAVLSLEEEYFENIYIDKNSNFFNFLPKLNYYDHKEMHDWLKESALEANIEKNKINIFLDSVFIK